MQLEEMPAAVADLIARGEESRAAREAERQRALAAAEAMESGLMLVFLAEARTSVPGLSPELAEYLTLPDANAASIQLNQAAEAVIDLPGCFWIGVHLERQLAGGWRVGRQGEPEPFRVAGSGGHRHATLAEAAAAARAAWLANQPAPAGIS